MYLVDLLKDSPFETAASGDVRIEGIAYDSRLVKPGYLFCAMPGVHVDGKNFIGKAIEAGAVAVAFSGNEEFPGAVNVHVNDMGSLLAQVSHRFYGDPSKTLQVIGVTGTNGKTSVVFIIESILAAAGKNVGVIGTVNYRYGGKTYPAPNTTPLALDLATHMAAMRDQGVDTVVMEVSSHALDQRRVAGVHFDVACYTNLSRDHLDYHADMEEYFEAKKIFFTEYLPASCKPKKTAVVNLDDRYGAMIRSSCKERLLTFGTEEGVDVRLRDAKVNMRGVQGRLVHPNGSIEIKSTLLGDFSVSNLLAASTVALSVGVRPEKIQAGIKELHCVPGRLEPVGDAPFAVLVDYAHTPDALENVLDTLNRLAKNRIITVFGCGGDRDPGKRPLMGAAVAERSHISVVTSDNPRTEDPNAIIDQILPGLEPYNLESLNSTSINEYRGGRGYVVEPDRRKAINLAVAGAWKNDIILIAGKGHEDYQILGTTKYPFDDRQEAIAAIKARNEKDE